MSHARRVLWTVATGLAVATGVACSSMGENSAFDNGTDGPSTSADGGKDFTPAPGNEASPQATGIVLVHAAAFPSFRLCFENFPDLRPQPDSRVMPEANVVGVEIGTLVRLDPMMQAPGTVYVVRESKVRTNPEDANPPTCGDLIKEINEGAEHPLEVNFDYQIATSLDHSLGQDRVSVIAITGCGGTNILSLVDGNGANCGDGWSSLSGNLKARTFDLSVARRKSESDLPVQLFQMSPELAALDANGSPLTVTFGPLGTDAGVPPSDGGGKSDAGTQGDVPVGGLYQGGESTSLSFDQDSSQIYSELGFRIVAKNVFSADQSLAAVQEFSAPRELPTSYYKAASSYALLLLGDPGHKPTLPNDAPNPSYNPRRAVHLLAIPVIDPESRDAGPDAGEETF